MPSAVTRANKLRCSFAANWSGVACYRKGNARPCQQKWGRNMLAANTTFPQVDQETQALALVCQILLEAAARRRARLAKAGQLAAGDARPVAMTATAGAEGEQP